MCTSPCTCTCAQCHAHAHSINSIQRLHGLKCIMQHARMTWQMIDVVGCPRPRLTLRWPSSQMRMRQNLSAISPWTLASRMASRRLRSQCRCGAVQCGAVLHSEPEHLWYLSACIMRICTRTSLMLDAYTNNSLLAPRSCAACAQLQVVCTHTHP
jgi:hypothetical protein